MCGGTQPAAMGLRVLPSERALLRDSGPGSATDGPDDTVSPYPRTNIVQLEKALLKRLLTYFGSMLPLLGSRRMSRLLFLVITESYRGYTIYGETSNLPRVPEETTKSAQGNQRVSFEERGDWQS